MLKSFTWGQFFGLSACLLVIYYAIIAIVYYRKELKNLVKGRRLAVVTPSGQLHAPANNEKDQYNTSDGFYDRDDEQSQIYEQVNSLTDDLGDLFNAATAEGWDKGQTLELVKRKLAGHENLADTPFETSINNYIVIQADKSGFARVSADELRGLWKNG